MKYSSIDLPYLYYIKMYRENMNPISTNSNNLIIKILILDINYIMIAEFDVTNMRLSSNTTFIMIHFLIFIINIKLFATI